MLISWSKSKETKNKNNSLSKTNFTNDNSNVYNFQESTSFLSEDSDTILYLCKSNSDILATLDDLSFEEEPLEEVPVIPNIKKIEENLQTFFFTTNGKNFIKNIVERPEGHEKFLVDLYDLVIEHFDEVSNTQFTFEIICRILYALNQKNNLYKLTRHFGFLVKHSDDDTVYKILHYILQSFDITLINIIVYHIMANFEYCTKGELSKKLVCEIYNLGDEFINANFDNCMMKLRN